MKKTKLFLIAISTAILLGGCAKTADNTDVDEQAPVSDGLVVTNDSNNEGNEVEEEAADALPDAIYYHSVSDADETGIYLGGAGSIYRIDPASEAQTIYAAPHIAGAALYKDYIFSIEYNVSDSGMTAELIRMNKDGSDKKVMTQISSGSYDLRIVDKMLVITEQIIGDYAMETLFYSYTLDDEGSLTSDTPQDAYARFGLPNGYEDGMCFLIDPWFSAKYFGYSCFMSAVGETGINSVWIKTEDEESAEEVVTCSGNPLVAKDMIFYCDSNGTTLTQYSLENAQETALYEIPDDAGLSLLTYDSEWVYFFYYLERARAGEDAELYSAIMRVNLQDHRTEEIYELQEGSHISKFNVYGNYCYFILSGEGDAQWKRYDLIAGNDIENLEDVQTASDKEKEVKESEEEEPEEITEPKENKNSAQLYAKYSEVLMQILTDRTDPNGKYFDDGSQGVDFSINAFAIIDIDGDGRDELIFNFNETYMAAMQEIIYDYDEKNDILRTELEDIFIITKYYSNGYVKEDASHNHTCDPETRGTWPYFLYKYDAETDRYINTGYVQCWDKLVFPTNYEGEAFPDEFDADGDSLLFFVDYFSKESDDVDRTYMDREEFETWEQTMFPDKYKIGIEYHHMTEEEITQVTSNMLKSFKE